MYLVKTISSLTRLNDFFSQGFVSALDTPALMYIWDQCFVLFQGFVSVLDTPAVMYIWDQCFMQGWQPSVLKHTSLALLELLREKFMNARDYSQMKEV